VRRRDRAGTGAEDRRAGAHDVRLLPRSRRQPHRGVELLRRAAGGRAMSAQDPAAIAPELAHLRKDYALKTLDEKDVDRDPMKQFGVWMVEAIHAARSTKYAKGSAWQAAAQ